MDIIQVKIEITNKEYIQQDFKVVQRMTHKLN